MTKAWLVALSTLLLVLAPLATAQDGAKTRRVKIELEDEGCASGEGRFCVVPDKIEIGEGRTLVLEVTNAGQVRHNLTSGPGSPPGLADLVDVPPLEPNHTATVELPWKELSKLREESGQRNVTLVCGFEGHAALGERLVLSIGEPAEERPQPGPGAIAALAAIGAAAVALRRQR